MAATTIMKLITSFLPTACNSHRVSPNISLCAFPVTFLQRCVLKERNGGAQIYLLCFLREKIVHACGCPIIDWLIQ